MHVCLVLFVLTWGVVWSGTSLQGEDDNPNADLQSGSANSELPDKLQTFESPGEPTAGLENQDIIPVAPEESPESTGEDASSEWRILAHPQDEELEAETEVLAELRAGGTDAIDPSKYPWMVGIFNLTNLAYMGAGIVVNKYWVVTSSIVARRQRAKMFLIMSGLTSRATLDDLRKGTAHVSNRRALHPERHASNNSIGLLRVCPPFEDAQVAVLPTSSQLAPGDQVTFLNFAPSLKQASKTVVASSECAAHSGWDPNTAFCLASSDSVFNNGSNREFSSPAVGVDGLPLGLNTVSGCLQGEAYLQLAKYTAWIQKKAFILPSS